MPILILMLMILSGASFAEDFRVLDLGKSCEGLMPKEKTIGGNYNYDYVAGYEYAFTTEFMGKASSAIYKCSEDNVLKEGVQFVAFDTANDAIDFFTSTKIFLLQEYGQPALDMSSDAVRQLAVKVGVKRGLAEQYHLYWKKETKNIHFSLAEIGEKPGEKQVIVALLVSAR